LLENDKCHLIARARICYDDFRQLNTPEQSQKSVFTWQKPGNGSQKSAISGTHKRQRKPVQNWAEIAPAIFINVSFVQI
jgi:hypothetical protein